MRPQLTFGACLLAMVSSAADPIRIPYASAPPSEDRFLATEWRGAAVMRNLFPSGSAAALAVPTTLYLMHDGRRLWVGAECADPAFPDQGQAFPRQPDEDLTLDESVQVVLGLGGGAEQTIDFGGYAGAQNAKLAPVAHFYEFTVNACGAISRTYNETPLRAPGFHAAASVSAGQGWQAVLRIPLASIGVDEDITGRMLHFNAFRFHRGVRYGLHLPAFGGYAGMPFVPAAFLSQPESAGRTLQTPLPPRQDTVAKPVGTLEFEFYPLARQLIATCPATEAAAAIRLSVAGGGPSQTTPVNSGACPLARLALSADRAGTPFAATAELLDAQGNVLTKQEKTFPFPPAPGWLGTDAGREYLTDRVPRAWAKPVLEGSRVKLAHAALDFDGQAVPSAVTVRDKPVLSAPVRIVAEVDGRLLAAGPVARTVMEPTRVLLESAPGTAMQIRTVVDFDGFMVVKCRFPGLDTRRLSKLELHVPLAPDVPRYVNRGHLQDTAKLGGYGYLGPKGAVWVGGADAGIYVSHDTPCFFAATGGEVQLTVPRSNPVPPVADVPAAARLSWFSRLCAPFRSGKPPPATPTSRPTPELVIRFVDAAGQVPSADYVFQFFLLPTPTRKAMPPPMLDRMGLWFEEWSDYEGYPDLKKMPEVKRRADAAHAEGKKFYLYFHMQLAENSPGFAAFRNDLMAPPARSWYKRAYDNPLPPHGADGHVHCQDVPCWVCCLRGPCGDLLLDGMRRLNRDGGVDGVYLDGPTHPFDCSNPSHDKCDDAHLPEWDDDATHGRILGQRQFIKRMRGVFEEGGSEFPLWPHVGGGLELATLSLCDFYYEGEHLARYRDGYRLPLGKFLVGYTGAPFGFRGIFLAQIYGFGGMGTQALPYSLVHGTEAATVVAPLQDKVFALGARDPEARFYPYWQPQPHIAATGDALPFSYWLAPDHATLVVANAGYNGEQRLSFDACQLFPGQTVSVTRLDNDEPVAAPENRFGASVPEDSVRAYLIAPRKPEATPAAAVPPPDMVRAQAAPVAFAPIRAFHPADWRIAGSVGAGTADAGAWPLLLVSRPQSAEAAASLQRLLPADCTVRLRVVPSGRLRIKVDSVALVWDGGWRCGGVSEFDPDGQLLARAVPFAAGAVAALDLGFRGGRLYAHWNGAPLLTRVLPQEPQLAHRLELATWAGDRLGMDVIEITGDAFPEWRRQHPTSPASSP